MRRFYFVFAAVLEKLQSASFTTRLGHVAFGDYGGLGEGNLRSPGVRHLRGSSAGVGVVGESSVRGRAIHGYSGGDFDL